jgi:hypothetical protein
MDRRESRESTDGGFDLEFTAQHPAIPVQYGRLIIHKKNLVGQSIPLDWKPIPASQGD